MMGSKITISRFVGLVFLVAALTGGTANAMARAYPSRPAASFYTPQALEAQGLRWQRMAQAYTPQPQVVRDSSFDWGAAGIGAVGVFVVLLCGGVLIFGLRRIREEKLAV
jgi:hypothetical protein